MNGNSFRLNKREALALKKLITKVSNKTLVQYNFVKDYHEVYKMPKAHTARRLKKYEKILSTCVFLNSVDTFNI